MKGRAEGCALLVWWGEWPGAPRAGRKQSGGLFSAANARESFRGPGRRCSELLCTLDSMHPAVEQR